MERLRFAQGLSAAELQMLRDVRDELMQYQDRLHILKRADMTSEGLDKLQSSQPGLVVVDYLQKFRSQNKDVRMAVTETAETLRDLAVKGFGIIALSATTRTSGLSGNGHDSNALTLASFKESGEIEFNVDSAYLLREKGGNPFAKCITLDCVKNRHGEMKEAKLIFRPGIMRFDLQTVIQQALPVTPVGGFSFAGGAV